MFPHNIGLGCTNDPELIYQVNQATAVEVAGTGLHWTFSPCITIPKDDRWGRQYEGFSESTELVTRLTAAAIKGYEDAIDSSWYENDGVVNSVSMTHPFGLEMMHFTGNPTKGTWQTMERINMDHQAVIGHNISRKDHDDLFALYNKHCQLLYKLKCSHLILLLFLTWMGGFLIRNLCIQRLKFVCLVNMA